ncbi:MAG TPA: ATP-grasp domain-containing protein, partial [Phycisphaerae bacterium]|nr:ATP-grasp domain-containing protein [Phycisphaerae bacterium]
MKVQEYQGRALMEAVGIPVPAGQVIDAPEQAADAFRRVGAETVVVKAQVHAGGRGKAGYVKLVKSADEAAQHAKRMFGNRMVSKQTGPQGVQVRKIMLAQAVDIAHEYYLGVVVDRARRTPVMMASAEGGVEI